MGDTKPIRVLQVGMSPYYGGTEAFIMEQYRHIDRSKVQFDFLNVYKEKIACTEEIEDLGGRIYNLDMSRHNGIRNYQTNLEAFFQAHSKSFQVIHCNYQSLINIDLVKYAQKYNIPMRIVHAHNAGYGSNPNFVQKILIFLNKLRVKRYTTHFFACSSLAARWMFPKNTSIYVIHNAIDAKKFIYNDDIRKTRRKEWGISENTFVCLFVGRLDSQKNPLFLIEIFSEIVTQRGDSLLLLAGDGYLKDKVKRSTSEKNLNDRVRILGNRNDVNELMQVADAFLLPSRFEGLGIVLIEAQAADLPCFTSKNVVPSAVNITNTVNFISLNSNAAIWSEKIISNSDSHQKRENKSRVISESGYNSETAVQYLQQLYLNQ